MVVTVLRGGESAEHDVSHRSATFVESVLVELGHRVISIHISREGRWSLGGGGSADLLPPNVIGALQEADVVFPVLHGPMGEDGTVQGLLEVLHCPYVGCTVAGSAVAMDKGLTKELCLQAGVPVLPGVVLDLRREEEWRSMVEAAGLTLPVFVKPCNMGSSVGVARIDAWSELEKAIAMAADHDYRVLVEQGLDLPREIEVSVLGNGLPRASVAGEILPGDQFYTYEDKYGQTKAEFHIPAQISEVLQAEAQALAVQVFRLLACNGLARVDFLLGEQGTLYLNEVNTLPGFTEISMYPKLWEATGMPVKRLFSELLTLGLEMYGRCSNDG